MLSTIYRIWAFKIFDIKEAESYINYMARRGYALKKIGTFFAAFEKTENMEYVYSIAIPEFKDDEAAEESYKGRWANDGWEFVQLFENQYIFRTKKRNLRPSEIIPREELNNRIIQKAHIGVIPNIIFAALAVFNGVIADDPLISWMWITGGLCQLATIGDFIRYMIFKGRIKNSDYIFSYDIEDNQRGYIWRIIIKLLLLLPSVICVAIGLTGLIVEGLYKPAAAILLILAIISGTVFAANLIRTYAAKKGEPLFFDTKKGKAVGLLGVSVITLVCIFIMISVSVISDNQSGKDYSRNTPDIVSEDTNGPFRVSAEYYKWEYDKEDGYYMGGTYNEFEQPTEERMKYYQTIVPVEDNRVEINFDKRPDHWEVRYWTKEDFLKIKSFDDNYQSLETDDNGFEPLKGDIYYVIYAKWLKAEEEGFGYFIVHTNI